MSPLPHPPPPPHTHKIEGLGFRLNRGAKGEGGFRFGSPRGAVLYLVLKYDHPHSWWASVPSLNTRISGLPNYLAGATQPHPRTPSAVAGGKAEPERAPPLETAAGASLCSG